MDDLWGCLPAIPPPVHKLTSVGLFAGIGGIERGLEHAGFETVELVELEPHAREVLATHFPSANLQVDVTQITRLKPATILSAGFPCKDLSSVGTKKGIDGIQSSLVRHVFRMIRAQPNDFEWLLLENVPNMLSLDAGRAMDVIVSALDELGWAWAYRTIDLRTFGIPHRRSRVILLASPIHDPRPVLLSEDAGRPTPSPDPRPIKDSYAKHPDSWFGFSPSEGKTGLGWVLDGVPVIKVGSKRRPPTPSPPAFWDPKTGQISTPDIRDAERLQSFPVDWTKPLIDAGHHKNWRWQGIGNAVPPVMSYWVGMRLRLSQGLGFNSSTSTPKGTRKWSALKAAWGVGGEVYGVTLSAWPVRCPSSPLESFLRYPAKDLSERWTAFWLRQHEAGRMNPPPEFVAAMRAHKKKMASRMTVMFAPVEDDDPDIDTPYLEPGTCAPEELETMEPWRTQICAHLANNGVGFPADSIANCAAEFDSLWAMAKQQNAALTDASLPLLAECITRIQAPTPDDLLKCADAIARGQYQSLPTYPIQPGGMPTVDSSVSLEEERMKRAGWGMWPWIALGLASVTTLGMGALAGVVYLVTNKPKGTRRRRRR